MIRDRIRAGLDRVGLYQYLAVETDLDREGWAIAWFGWFITLLMYPIAVHGSQTAALGAYGVLVGLWVLGATYAYEKNRTIRVIGRE